MKNLNSHQVIFDTLDWIHAGVGVRYKSVVHNRQRLRLVEFSEGFIEQDWCLQGHAGIVLDGSFALDFNGNVERYAQGDIIFIPSGESDKHKAILGKGEKVTLLLFELLER